MDKKTPFYSLHKKYNAKFISFAGYKMPIQYQGVNIEHNHVRNFVGVFDVSHMAQIMITGIDAFNLVQRLTTNDIAKMRDGKVQYSCMLNVDGGIVDDLLVYRFSSDAYMLVVNAANAEKDLNWISQHSTDDANINNITHDKGLLAIQGPKSYSILQKLTDIKLDVRSNLLTPW